MGSDLLHAATLVVACLCLATATLAAKPPPNDPAGVSFSASTGKLTVRYNGGAILTATVLGKGHVTLNTHIARGKRDEVEQRMVFTGKSVVLRGTISASDEAFPAETRGDAQRRFPLVRNTVGLSHNLRNNAVFDRKWDWMLEWASGEAGIAPEGGRGARMFALSGKGDRIELIFRPRYYQKHKNLHFFEPWNYDVRQDSITGWCSWWAYMTSFTQVELRTVLDALRSQNMADFGYRFIQIDDTYEGGGGTPESWLKWNGKFPGGADGYVRAVRQAGFEPAVWMGTFFRDEVTVTAHPEWFVHDETGKPCKGPWIEYGLDATNDEAVDAIVRPTFQGFHKLGFSYVKVDALRHLLYDCYHRRKAFLKGAPAGMFRKYLGTVREALGRDTFMLSCWGVLPETVGIADGCRIGGDGFGPATLQQYNSWNGVVWRNDPDHCDVLPRDGGTAADTILRPSIVSMAGAMLMLSDKAEVYRQPEYLEGAKRASPVLFTVPGQLYDFDPSKSDWLLDHDRTEITTGGPASPVDARQNGDVCPWWLLEIDRPFENWSVLARFNFTDKLMAAVSVSFADLGLRSDAEYLVYEFWSKRFVGVFRGTMPADELGGKDVRVYCIRAKLNRPQVLSTSRHIAQGAVDLQDVQWDGKVLQGRSTVVKGDPYTVTWYVPKGYTAFEATFDGKPASLHADGEAVSFTFTPSSTGTVEWEITSRR